VLSSDASDASVLWFCSWSGGKDCCLALHRIAEVHGPPRALLTMLIEGGGRSRSHGLDVAVLEAQATALGVPLLLRATSWDDYRATFVAAARELAGQGVRAGVFGDMDTDAHREWEESVCREAGLAALLPLWGADRLDVVREFLARGWEARIVAARADALGPEFLGRVVSEELIEELIARGVDPCGEYGEYHTVVTGGPLFREPLRLIEGERLLRAGVWFLDFKLAAE
jgi:diphthine-ammonia ligase